MKLGIMQPYFFPYIGYWQLINAVDKYVIYDDVNFIKNGWICRNRILMNGEPFFLSLHTFGASPNILINEVKLSSNKIIRIKMLKTLQACYGKAPFFNDAYPVIEKIITNEEDYLSRFLTYSIKEVCNYIGIDTKIVVSSDLTKNNKLRGQEKVLAICNILSADEYINAIGGKDLYSKENFIDNKVKLSFVNTLDIQYQQFKNIYVPNLSIIDIMMFNSVSSIKILLNKYELA